jgi:hypothetical protein
MNSLIWRNLPSELIRKIVLLSDPTIDTRLYFNISPKRLDTNRAWDLWFRLSCHDRIIYNMTSKSLHIFRLPECHIIHRPIELDATDEWFSIFNQDEKEHRIETTTINRKESFISRGSFYTEMRVLLKD